MKLTPEERDRMRLHPLRERPEIAHGAACPCCGGEASVLCGICGTPIHPDNLCGYIHVLEDNGWVEELACARCKTPNAMA